MRMAHLSIPALAVTAASSASAQEQSKTAVPLTELIEEAEKNNAQLLEAQHGSRAAMHVARQVTTLPDVQLTLQQFSVGSPRPFAGYTNSDFAYIGLGASQSFPYPGKLRLKGLIAEREVGFRQAQADELRSSITDQVKAVYFHLAYLQQTLALLESSGNTLKQIVDTELSRYRAGQGSQANVLKAQLERTKLVREITMHHEQMAQYEADLKLLLHRPQDSADIVPEELNTTPLTYKAAELLSFVQNHNPAVQSEKAALSRQAAQLQSAERGGKPDFGLGYLFEETGNRYRDYYMLTFDVTVPRRRRVEAEIAEAGEMQGKAKASLDAELQRQLAEVQKQYVAATSAAELLVEYRNGLLPQAQAVFRAHLAAFQSSTGELSAALSAFGDVLDLDRESAQVQLDHELAISRLETLTGVALR
jgi:cobalt-zinc-cadmium efflux system outer membrane protein